MISNYIRKKISSYFTRQSDIVFQDHIPDKNTLIQNFNHFEEIGIYLHIPFCDRICPYCPYNKEIFSDDQAKKYIQAVKKEIENYAAIVGNKTISSFYIGGGTPSTLLGKGIEEIINHIYKHFNVKCGIHMECHPNHINSDNLNTIKSLNIDYVSIGIESLQDKHLKLLHRPYSVNEVKKRVELALSKDFKCVNIDYIFDLPEQTEQEIHQAATDIVKMGVNQVATYPLFRFHYTHMDKIFNQNGNAIKTMFRRREFLKIFEDTFYNNDYWRSSVWAFTQKGIDKYCSVTVPTYLGLGASGSSYLNDIFYVNTFSVNEYIKSIKENKSPIALSVNLTEEMQMAAWLYWRIYETKFKKSDFEKRFGVDLNSKYKKLFKLWSSIGYLKNEKDEFLLTDKGSYWIHAFEDFFSINYINKFWGKSQFEAWPKEIIL